MTVAVFVGIAAGACRPGPVDYDEDFTEEVERICADYCEMNLACHEPPWFDTYDECETTCLGTAYVYNDTACGEARRAIFECVGATATCEEYNDTNNVHADNYTCKSEKDHWLDLDCGTSDEDPHMGAP